MEDTPIHDGFVGAHRWFSTKTPTSSRKLAELVTAPAPQVCGENSSGRSLPGSKLYWAAALRSVAAIRRLQPLCCNPEADVPCADHWFYGEAARCSGKTVESSAVLRMMHGRHDRNPFVNTWSLPILQALSLEASICCLHPRSMTDGAKSTAPGSKKKACSSSCGRGFCWKKPTKQPSRLPRCFKGQDIKDEGPAYALPPCFIYRWGFMGAFVGHPLRVGQDSPAALSGLHFRSPAHNFKEFGSLKTTRRGCQKSPGLAEVFDACDR